MWHLSSELLTFYFIPHGHCYLWKPGLVSLHVISDALIALSYYSIPITLFYFVNKRKDLPFNWIFLLFSGFIVACGTTHIMEIWTLWFPTYWVSGLIKALTAIISVFTAVQLIPLVPQALALPSPAELERANQEIKLLNEKLTAENLRMGAELEVTKRLQQMILPQPEELEIEGLDIAGYMEPADEVGGDYYDVLHTDGVTTLGIGDVTGHGLESGILMVMTQTAVRTLKEVREYDPVKFLDALNRTIYKNVQRMNSEKNLTLAVLNYSEGNLSISGQHEETLIVRSDGKIERIDTMDLGFPIGLDDDIASLISHATVKLQPGEGVVLYTDGIPEAYDIDKKQYGVEQLCVAISQNWQNSAQVIKDAVITDVRRHIGKQKVFDDITLLVLKREAEQPDLVS
ncbi:PP2C family protein-serine/threonine phosphatase [uncultured Nostoc sp.]|uniref:PP2C family protein-serine/threonine phosphatase n=1 Tax=uncultured Nostoc sp. TaxID=340711 RepID=UPI0035CAA56C